MRATISIEELDNPTREDWILKLSDAFLNDEYINFYGKEIKITSTFTDHINWNDYMTHTFIFSDGSQLTLKGSA